MLQKLSYQVLIHAYVKAMTLKLDSHFIYLLRMEINSRHLSLVKDETPK
ncbi:sporulation histidine kinase inhibitor Sda [Priestia megaterium]